MRHTSQVRCCRGGRNQKPSNTPTYAGQLKKDSTGVAKATSGHCLSRRAVTVTLRLENEKVSMINKIPLPRSSAILSGFPTGVSHKVAEAQWLLLLVASWCWLPFIICCSCSASAGMNYYRTDRTKLTLSSTHLSNSLFSLNSHSRPEDVIQKVLSAFLPLPHATSAKKLFLSSPSNPERPSKGTVALTYQ